MSLLVEAHLAGPDDLELLVSPTGRAQLVRALRALDPPIRVRHAGDSLRVALRDGHRLEAAADVRFRWEPAAATAVDNRRRVAHVAPRVLAAAGTVTAGGASAARSHLGDWSHRLELDDHQLVNVAVMTLADGWGACVFDEQGTGKTVTTIACFDLLVERREADTLLLIAPKSMVGEWRSEFGKFCGDLYRVEVLDGNRRDRVEQMHSGADVVVLGYETAVAHELELRLLAEKRRAVLVVDESFNVKNPQARRTDAIKRIRELCRRCFVLCGTPAPNRARDVVAQFDLVDFGYAFDGFRASEDRASEQAAVTQRMSTRGLYTRNLKDIVLPDLPPRSFRDVELELEPVQARAYDAAVHDLVIDLESIDDDAYQRQILSFLERRLTLLRICSNPSSLLPGYDETPAKLLALDQILAAAADDGEKVVVWSFFRSSLDAIADRYAHYGLVRVDGSTPSLERREAVRRFQADDVTTVFLGNPAAAGAGITLHRARTAVYESIGNQAAHWMQSLDRIHRRGQDRDVRYLLLVSKGTIEEIEFERVRQKATSQGELLGDSVVETPTRRVLIDSLRRPRRDPALRR